MTTYWHWRLRTLKEHQDGRREMGLRACGQGPNALGDETETAFWQKPEEVVGKMKSLLMAS
jgi:hypothetical protein